MGDRGLWTPAEPADRGDLVDMVVDVNGRMEAYNCELCQDECFACVPACGSCVEWIRSSSSSSMQ